MMSNFVKSLDWERYKRIINNFINEDAGKQPFMWLHKVEQKSAYGEDSNIIYLPVLLEGLFHYNYIRTWANNRQRDTNSGELEAGDAVLYISSDLLKKANLLNEYGYWDFNWAEDRFILNGKVYQPGGDTQVSQAKDEVLLFFVILQRMNPEETNKILYSYSGPELKVIKNDGIWLIDCNGNTIKDILNKPINIQGEPIIILNR